MSRVETGQGVYQKSPKKPKTRKATPEEIEHMGRAKMLPCRGCGRHGPNDYHHVRKFGEKKKHKKGFTLCPACHRPHFKDSLHDNRRKWVEVNGSEESHVAETMALLYPE